MNPSDSYSRIDRLLYRLAFGATTAQKALADIENMAFSAKLSGPKPERPIFITSLPRAGTTLLLELLAGLPELASHTYRDMPFLLCPMFWDQISRGFRTSQQSKERAHGDGLAVNTDSPEAFEEILWKAYWKAKYMADRLDLWSASDRDQEFETFLSDHMRKICVLRDGQRYVSKNNANIARLPLLARLYPDCRIVVPIRKPVDHCRSLLRQHRRFSESHKEDHFGRQYMEWLGHYEFGAALRPINFNNWLNTGSAGDPFAPDFWLRYWHNAYEAVLIDTPTQVTFVDYDRLCAEPDYGAEILGAAADLDNSVGLSEALALVRASTQYQDDEFSNLKGELIDSVQVTYDKLLENS